MLRALIAVLAVAALPLRPIEAQAASMRVTIPSPTAAALGRFGDVPVSLYSGVPDVTVPIFAVQGRTLRLPITLKYQGGGTRVEDIGGWAGIGMALEAGGVITRSVRGVPDDKDAGYLNTGSVFLTDANWLTPSASLIDNIRNGSVDGEPDQFFFSFAGVSGQFALGPVSGGGVQYRSMPYRKLRIVPTGGVFAEISGWTITTEDGTRYTFAATETHTDYSTNSTGAIPPNYGQTYASSWHLTEVRAPGGDLITLQYTTYTAQHKQGTYVEKFDLVQTPVGMPACVPNVLESFNEFMVTGQRLTSITSAAHTVTFSTTLRTDALSPAGTQQEHRLDLITVATPGGTVLRKFKFEHDYSTGRLTLKNVYEQDRNNVSLPPYTFTYAGPTLPVINSMAQDHWGFYNGKEINTTLVPTTIVSGLVLEGGDRSPDPAYANAGVLSRVTYPTGGWNEFVWESNDYGAVGTNDSPPIGEGPEQNAAVNSWSGGSTTFTVGGTEYITATLFVSQTPTGCGQQFQPPCPYTRISGGTLAVPYEWDTNGTFNVQLGPGVYTLTANDQGTYPDGWAAIQVRWRDLGAMNKVIAGGLRVAEVRTADAMGNVTVRKYKYTLQSAPSRSSGTIMAAPAYGYFFPGILCQYYSRTSMSRMPLGNGGPTVAYREVEVWHGASAEFGKTRHLFRSTLTAGAADALPGSSAWPYSRVTSMEFKRGQQTTTTEYNAAGFAQQRTASKHVFRDTDTPDPVTTRRFRGLSINTFSAGYTLDAAAWGYVFNPFEVISAWAYTESDTTVTYDDGGVSSFTTARNYAYGNPAHTQLTQLTETNSNGNQRITRMTYPADYTAGAGDAEAVAMTAMQADSVHNHAAVVERWVIEKVGATETVMQAALTTYRSGTARPLPYQTFVLNNPSGVTNFVPSAITGGSFTRDYRHLLQETGNTYDSWGRLTQLTDPRGNVTNYLYGGTNMAVLTKVTRVKDASGIVDLVTDLTYDSDGFVSSIRDEAGTNRTFTYDLYGRLRQVKNHAGTVVKAMGYVYSRTLANSWTYQTGSPNAVIDTTFVQQTPSVVRLVSTGYLDGLGRPIQGVQQDGSNYVVSATQYDLLGRSWRAWKPYTRGIAGYDPGFATNSTTFYNTYLVQSLAKPYVETQYTTDALSRVKTVIPEFVGAAATAFMQTTYGVDVAPKHTFVETTDEVGKKTRTYADVLGNGVKTILGYTAAEATTTQFTMNVLGQRTQITDPRALVTTYTQNTRGLQTSTTSPDAGTKNGKYDKAGNLRFSQDANQAAVGQVAFTNYDFAARPLVSGQGAASFAALDPDLAPGALETTSANWLVVRAYDAKPSGATFPWSLFSAQLAPLTLSNVSGRLGAVASKSGGSWQATFFSYDTDGRVAIRYTFTQANGGGAVLTALNTTVTYARDLRDALTQRSLTVGANSFYHWYEYDGRGLLWKAFAATTGIKPGTPDVTYTYRPSGQPQGRQFAGGPLVPLRYTIREQLERIGDPALTTYPFSARYAYHANSTVSESEFYSAGSPAVAKRYRYVYGVGSYDALNRLKSADFSSRSGSVWTSTLAHDLANISYDLSGNLTGLQRYRETATLLDNLNYTTDAASNRLAAVTDAIAGSAEPWDAETGAFMYDANGNLLTAPAPYALTNVTYDGQNLPLTLTRSGITTAYRYDAAGVRIAKQVGAGATEVYVLDGATTLGVVTVNGAGTATSWHFNVLAGERVVGRQPNVGARRYYHTDLLGSTRAVVQGTTVVESYDADPWGLLLPGRTLGSGTKEGFTGKERDLESGMDYFGARYYLPALGRWAAVDPLGEGSPAWSPYNYTHNNPVLRVDPFGLCDPWPKCANDYWDNVAVAGHTRGGFWGNAKAVAATAMSSLIENAGVNQADKGLDMAFAGQPVAGAALVVLAVAGNLPGGKALSKVDDVVEAAGDAVTAVRAAKGGIGATGKIGEEALRALGGESQVYFRTSQGGRYVDQLVDGFANESKVGYQSLTPSIRRQIGKDVELMRTKQIQGATWNFFTSPVTGLGGPSQPLLNALRQNGINVIFPP